MQKFPNRPTLRLLLLTGLVAITACDAPDGAEIVSSPLMSASAGVTLLECPSDERGSAEELILPLGGLVRLGGNEVVVPGGALVGATEISIESPSSPHMRVDLRANDQDHWQFLLPVTVTIDYSRCAAEALDGGPLSVWHIDTRTGELLENMGGIDDRLLRRITFTTDHFSGYAIAN